MIGECVCVCVCVCVCMATMFINTFGKQLLRGELPCEQETGNTKDTYAVAVQKRLHSVIKFAGGIFAVALQLQLP